MKIFNIILVWSIFNILRSYKLTILKNSKLRKLYNNKTITITENKIVCIKNETEKDKIRKCLNNLHIYNYEDAKSLISSICQTDIKTIKQKMNKNKNKNLFKYLNKLEIFFNNENITLKKYNTLLNQFNDDIKKNKLIVYNLNKIKKYLNKIIIIKGVFTNENLKKYDDIKNSLVKDLAEAQFKNEASIKKVKDNLNQNKSSKSKIKSKITKKDVKKEKPIFNTSLLNFNKILNNYKQKQRENNKNKISIIKIKNYNYKNIIKNTDKTENKNLNIKNNSIPSNFTIPIEDTKQNIKKKVEKKVDTIPKPNEKIILNQKPKKINNNINIELKPKEKEELDNMFKLDTDTIVDNSLIKDEKLIKDNDTLIDNKHNPINSKIIKPKDKDKKVVKTVKKHSKSLKLAIFQMFILIFMIN